MKHVGCDNTYVVGLHVVVRCAINTGMQRFDGMKQYKMAQVISATPILLHASLMCFSIGLVDFLWTLNQIVAIPVSIYCII